jgi:hypothetical protein
MQLLYEVVITLLAVIKVLFKFVIAIFISCYQLIVFDSEKKEGELYYFPQIDTYLKIDRCFGEKYGYIFFSKDSTFSDTMDYIKKRKTQTTDIKFMFNPLENNKIFLYDHWNSVVEINQVNFIMEKIKNDDTTFFEPRIVNGAKTHIVKPSYFRIVISHNLDAVLFADYEEEYLKWAEQIK